MSRPISRREFERLFPKASKSCIRANENNPDYALKSGMFNESVILVKKNRGLAGWHSVGGKHFYARSRWESNYSKFLEFQKQQNLIKDWEHENFTFWFLEIKRGVRSYLPDFEVTLNSGAIEYHEVKGWMDPKSKTKIKRMAKYYPDVKLIVIGAEWFKKSASLYKGLIKDWE